jgi:hypothetical protein
MVNGARIGQRDCPGFNVPYTNGRHARRGQDRRPGVHCIPESALAEDLVEQPERLNKEIKRRADVVEIFPAARISSRHERGVQGRS